MKYDKDCVCLECVSFQKGWNSALEKMKIRIWSSINVGTKIKFNEILEELKVKK